MQLATPVRLIRPDEQRAAAAMLARSFDGDPMFRYLLPGERQRAAWLPYLFGQSLAHTLPDGGAWTTGDSLDGAILMAEPGRFPFPWTRGLGYFLRFWQRAGVPWPSWHIAKNGPQVQRAIDAMHHRGPHVYVYVLGVDPKRQGTGAGGRLMRHAVGRADALGVALYLETTNPNNIGYYRRFGLEVTEEVVAAPGVPPIWAMVRGPAQP